MLSDPAYRYADVFFRQKCDTFSRSSQAVFELSTRFSQHNPHSDELSETVKTDKDKLIFHELTQSQRSNFVSQIEGLTWPQSASGAILLIYPCSST